MNIRILLIVGSIVLLSGCKENQSTTKPKLREEENATLAKVPHIIKELALLADPTFSDTTNIDHLFIFKEIDANGSIDSTSITRAADLYRKIKIGEELSVLPIFEIKGTDTAILPIQGVGFGGAIWAKVLVDKKVLEIKKIAFEHKAESEGYGAVISQNLFEDQFVGTKINLEQHTVTFQKAIEKAVDDGQIIDGLSGATMTGQAVEQMINEGLRKYRNYFDRYE